MCKPMEISPALRLAILLPLLLLSGWLPNSLAIAQLSYEKPPINYGSAKPNDAVSQLAAQLDTGELTLKYDSQWGWLPSIIEQGKQSGPPKLRVN